MTKKDDIGVIGRLHGELVHKRRVRVLGSHIATLMPDNATVLDVGCGDGLIDAFIMSERPGTQITGVDVMARPAPLIPVTLFDGGHIPFGDKSFDVVMFVDTLHHTKDPLALLQEAKRVTRRTIIIKDHLIEGLLAGPTLRLMDWVGNAPHGVVLSYNYLKRETWQRSIRELGMKVCYWNENIGLYSFPASIFFDRSLHFIAVLEP
jgi:SAM-dependent methyltransferase